MKILWRPDKNEIALKAIEKYRYGLRKIVSRHFNFSIMKRRRHKKKSCVVYFPGVIDLLGAMGGLVEFKAALLTSHGFAALALAYIGYDDLPAFPLYHEMEYFEDAANWLSSHPKVLPHGIGIHAICYGAMIALLMANLQMKLVKAIAAISPLIHVHPTAFKYKESFISGVAHYDQSKKVLFLVFFQQPPIQIFQSQSTPTLHLLKIFPVRSCLFMELTT